MNITASKKVNIWNNSIFWIASVGLRAMSTSRTGVGKDFVFLCGFHSWLSLCQIGKGLVVNNIVSYIFCDFEHELLYVAASCILC